MNQLLQLSDEFGAFEAKPELAAQGGLVVLQEIFGVNAHIRDVCRHYATLGFDCIAPALFDPAEKNVELGNGDMKKGIALKQKISDEQALRAIELAVAELHRTHEKVSVIGYCWGGSLAFLAACRLPGLHRAVAYYGSEIVKHRNEKPLVPVMMHFGRLDKHMTEDVVDQIRETQGQYLIYVYEADHGFNRDTGEAYDATSARLAEQRSVDFLEAD